MSNPASSQDFTSCPHCRGRYKTRGLAIHIRSAHRDLQQPNDTIESTQNNEQNVENGQNHVPQFLQDLFVRGFGAPLVNTAGGDEDNVWHVRWRRATLLNGRQYILPQGAVGRQFVNLLTKEIQDVSNGNCSSERIFFMCATILQKDKMITSSTDIRRLLKKRMDMWSESLFDELLQEATRCDRHTKTSRQECTDEHKVRIFTRLVLQGKLRDATRWITDRSGGAVLLPDSLLPDGRSVLQILETKHPEQRFPDEEMFMKCDTLPVMVDIDVTAGHVEKVARSMRGGAGPSGTDADQWKSMLLRYGTHSQHLREAVASLIRKLANGIVDWNSVRALLARRGIALDKCPGVRPIGIGEVLQRICAKTMAHITGEDVREECGADQLCAGTKAGIESAIHAMSDLFDEDDDTSILLVDASNAFNSISRPLTLWSARILWPRCARFLFNTYRGYAKIVFRNTEHIILSKEGTTQGDPLAMMMYAIGILTIIKSLKSEDYRQTWYADDSACLGKLAQVRRWFDVLMREGPKWGYFPEPSKSVLVVKPNQETEAKTLFSDLKVSIVTSHRFLGGVIGTKDAKINFVKEKVAMWVDCIKKLSNAAVKSPQAAYTSFTKSLQAEWIFTQRVVADATDEYNDLFSTIRQYFTPSLFGHETNDIENDLFELPVRYGGLDIKNPMKTSQNAHNTSKRCVQTLTDAIKNNQELNLNTHVNRMKEVITEEKKKQEVEKKEESDRLIALLPERQRRPLIRIVEGKASHWLSVVPTAADHFDLSPVEFRDALALRYGKNLQNLPTLCDGCGTEFTITHALNCKKGGLIKHGHDQLRDYCAATANLAYNSVGIEPLMRESSNDVTALYADFKAVSVWEAGRVAFFDNRIVNADAPSYASQSWTTTANRHAAEKHRKYDTAAEEARGSFTPLVCSVEAVLHKEYDTYVKRLSFNLATKWNKAYSQILSWVKAQLEISIIKAVGLRIRGTRRLIRSLPYEDGAGIPHFYI